MPDWTHCSAKQTDRVIVVLVYDTDGFTPDCLWYNRITALLGHLAELNTSRACHQKCVVAMMQSVVHREGCDVFKFFI